MSETPSHPSAERLAAFGLGQLAPHELADVERHVADCDVCCQALRGVAADTLLELAQSAVARPVDLPPSVADEPAALLPPELANHPRYRIVELLGAGGRSVVCRAEHCLMERLVALQVIPPRFVADPSAVERFRREVKAAARLAHPNIVAAYDADQAGALHFLVMEFIQGVSLANLVA